MPMGTILQMMKNAEQLSSEKLKNDLFKFIRSIEDKLIEIETDRLFNESKDIFGQPLGFYSYATEVISKGKKKKGEPFTSKDSGDFFKGFYVEESQGVLTFGSKDPKTKTILSGRTWLSSELFGLSDKELEKLIETDLLPFHQQNVRQILNV